VPLDNSQHLSWNISPPESFRALVPPPKLSLPKPPPPPCAICGQLHRTPFSGIRWGSFKPPGPLWIGASCWGIYTILVAEGYYTLGELRPKGRQQPTVRPGYPTFKEMYRTYALYAKKHAMGEPWWNDASTPGMFLDHAAKRTGLITTQIGQAMATLFGDGP
jgi:hypothetical protein